MCGGGTPGPRTGPLLGAGVRDAAVLLPVVDPEPVLLCQLLVQAPEVTVAIALKTWIGRTIGLQASVTAQSQHSHSTVTVTVTAQSQSQRVKRAHDRVAGTKQHAINSIG